MYLEDIYCICTFSHLLLVYSNRTASVQLFFVLVFPLKTVCLAALCLKFGRHNSLDGILQFILQIYCGLYGMIMGRISGSDSIYRQKEGPNQGEFCDNMHAVHTNKHRRQQDLLT